MGSRHGEFGSGLRVARPVRLGVPRKKARGQFDPGLFFRLLTPHSYGSQARPGNAVLPRPCLAQMEGRARKTPSSRTEAFWREGDPKGRLLGKRAFQVPFKFLDAQNGKEFHWRAPKKRKRAEAGYEPVQPANKTGSPTIPPLVRSEDPNWAIP